MSKIACVISSLGTGGAERVMSLLASEFSRRGHHVTLITLAPAGADFYALDPAVIRVGLNLLQPSCSRLDALVANVRRVWSLRTAFREIQPDVVISFITETNVLSAVASVGSAHRLIVSERVDPDAHALGAMWSLFRRVAYGRAQMVVAQTERASKWFAARGVPASRLTVIVNPVVRLPVDSGPPLDLPKDYLLGAGRLVPQKGFDVLIEAFALVATSHPELHLVICGDGPERDALLELANRLGVGHRLRLPGRVSLGPVMRRARLFVLSSRFEGFPNVLLEALALGVPVVATDCPSGPREILGERLPEALVPVEDAPAIASQIEGVLSDERVRSQLSDRGLELATEYSLERIADRWVSLMREDFV